MFEIYLFDSYKNQTLHIYCRKIILNNIEGNYLILNESAKFRSINIQKYSFCTIIKDTNKDINKELCYKNKNISICTNNVKNFIFLLIH